ncbi:MAG: class I SAM-dependent methyltransferase [Chloroflexota bacterium]
MSLNWMDTQGISFNSLLLLERVQISWMADWSLDQEMALALRANPAVAWYLRHKCPEAEPWLERLEAIEVDASDAQAVYAAEQHILQKMNDWLVYVVDPAVYDAQPFLNWDSQELSGLVDFSGKVVLDIGAGTGRLAFVAAPQAQTVYCVEPVGNLRCYIREKARRMGLHNVYAVDGLITEIPFPDGFADVCMGGHVFGDEPERELSELERVTRPGGMVILCPGSSERENEAHQVLVKGGYQWSRFEEPRDGWKRKYWKVME